MKRLNYFFLMFLSLSFVACEDEDESVLDTERPTITITSPTSQDEVNPNDEVNVSATVRDNLGLESVSISVTPPGGEPQVVHTEDVRDFLNDNTEADIDEDIRLGTNTPEAGAYTITVSALDTRGNTAEQSVTVNVGEADANAPTITINSPMANDDFATGEDMTVTASVAENMRLSQVIIEVSPDANNSTPIYQDTVTTFDDNTAYDINETITIPLDAPVGAYSLTVWAVDWAGNSVEESIAFSVTQGTGNANAINISGVEEGASYENIGMETPVSYGVTDPEGADSVNVRLLNQDGVELMNQGYNQDYFTENDIDNTAAFDVEDNLYVPNVGASRGDNTLTVTTYRNNNGTWEATGTQSRTFTSSPQPGAREINVTTTAPEGFDENSSVYLAGNFRGADRYGRDYDPAYELTRNDDGTYGTTLYANPDQNFNYRYSTMDAEGNASVEVDANCAEVTDYPRAYTYADGSTTVQESVNYTGYGACVQ